MNAQAESTALAALLGQLGGDRVAHQRFIRDFVMLWDVRLARLADALTHGDTDEAIVVLLSIRTSSSMVGATALEATAARMHAALRGHDLARASGCMRRLADDGALTCWELSGLLDVPERAR